MGAIANYKALRTTSGNGLREVIQRVHTRLLRLPQALSVGSVAAQYEWPLIPACVLSIAPRAWSIDRFLCLRHLPTRALANQNAAPHLRQSERLSGHHA